MDIVCFSQIKQWCATIDNGHIPAQVTTFLNNLQQTDVCLKSVSGDSPTDGDAPTEKCQQNFTSRVKQTEQSSENRLEQNVISADIQWHTAISMELETLINTSTVEEASDLDQHLEDWGDILQCCDFSPTGAL